MILRQRLPTHPFQGRKDILQKVTPQSTEKSNISDHATVSLSARKGGKQGRKTKEPAEEKAKTKEPAEKTAKNRQRNCREEGKEKAKTKEPAEEKAQTKRDREWTDKEAGRKTDQLTEI